MSHNQSRGELFTKHFFLRVFFLMLIYNYSRYYSFIKTIHSLTHTQVLKTFHAVKLLQKNLGCFSFEKKVGWNRQRNILVFL